MSARSFDAVHGTQGATHADDDTHAFGFWVFLMSDAVLFAVLFATYAVMTRGIGAGPAPHEAIDLRYAFPETLILLTSTLTMGLAMIGVHTRNPRTATRGLAVTLALGVAFLAFEFAEFADMRGRGLVPQLSGFLSGFYALVGAHGLHVATGLVWGGVMLAALAMRGVDDATRARLVRFSLYWHFLDLVWVGIFSFVYLRAGVT